MAKRSLILTSTSAKGNTLSKSITDINPKTEDVVLRTFAQKLNNMTTNTYVRTDCVDKFNVDTEGDLRVRQTPTITISDDMPKLANVQAGGKSGSVYHTSDGTLYMRRKSGCNNVGLVVKTDKSEFENVALNKYGSTTATGGVIIIGLTGTDNFKPIEVEYTLE